MLVIHSLVCKRHFLFSLATANEAFETDQNMVWRRDPQSHHQRTTLPSPKTPILRATTTTPELVPDIALVY